MRLYNDNTSIIMETYKSYFLFMRLVSLKAQTVLRGVVSSCY